MMLHVRSWLFGVLIGGIGMGQLCCLSAPGARAFTRDQDVRNTIAAPDVIQAHEGGSIDVDKITTQVSTTVSNELWPIMVLVICWVVFDTIKSIGFVWLIMRLRYTREKKKWNEMCGNHGANPPADPRKPTGANR